MLLWSRAIRYTSGQVRLAIGIPQQTYRHWKTVLSPLRRDGRRGPCFSTGDLLAVAVVHRVHAGYGIPARAIAGVGEELFKVCNSAQWLTLGDRRLVIDLENRRIELELANGTITGQAPTLVVPLRPIVEELQSALLAGSKPDDQEVLRFPPTPLPGRLEASPSRSRS